MKKKKKNAYRIIHHYSIHRLTPQKYDYLLFNERATEFNRVFDSWISIHSFRIISSFFYLIFYFYLSLSVWFGWFWIYYLSSGSYCVLLVATVVLFIIYIPFYAVVQQLLSFIVHLRFRLISTRSELLCCCWRSFFYFLFGWYIFRRRLSFALCPYPTLIISIWVGSLWARVTLRQCECKIKTMPLWLFAFYWNI